MRVGIITLAYEKGIIDSNSFYTVDDLKKARSYAETLVLLGKARWANKERTQISIE